MLEHASQPADALVLDGLTSGYGAIDVIKSLSLVVRRGEVLALLGKNGMGKTTLLKTIMGFLSLRRGKAVFEGNSIGGLSASRLIAGGIGYAPQELPLFQDLTIRDNLRLAITRDADFKRTATRAFAYFPFLSDRLMQKAGTLSGGEQKMLILARALMLEPRLLLIDEISEGLQPSVVARIADALIDQKRKGTTILLVEQNLEFALKVADRWAVLKLGEINDTGDADQDAPRRVLSHLTI